jgi:DNA polymerase-3 subunit epsilon
MGEIMREVVLDTETTGLDPSGGHRIVEVGCVELLNHAPTGRTYQAYINPQRPMPAEAFNVHGLSDAFLAEKPLFAEIAEEFATFLGDSPLVIHNASFDLGFINAEFGRLGYPQVTTDRAIDTVHLARKKFPGSPASLDALCRRFQVDISDRNLHGALKDARLLSVVYLELLGGRQPGLELISAAGRAAAAAPARTHQPRLVRPTAEEERAHAVFLDRLTDSIWKQLS